MDRYQHLALAAAEMAIADAQLKVTPANEDKVGVVIATGLGGASTLERDHELWLGGDLQKISPFLIPAYIPSMAAGQVAMRFGAKGPNFSPTTACAASTHAVGDAARLIQRGDADVVITGGAEASVTPPILIGFAIFVGILAGCYPALFLSNFQPARTVKGTGGQKSKGNIVLRRALVVLQFAATFGIFFSTFVVHSVALVNCAIACDLFVLFGFHIATNKSANNSTHCTSIVAFHCIVSNSTTDNGTF